MKTSWLIGILSCTAALLLAANWYVRRPLSPPAEDEQTSLAEEQSAQSAAPSPTLPPSSEVEVTTREMRGSLEPAPLKWKGIESTNYVQYAANLRAMGLPEELVRKLIIADINTLYAEREEALKTELAPYDASRDERVKRTAFVNEFDRLQELRRVQMEKQAVLKNVLGIDVPRPLLKSPTTPRNYEGHEYALSLLPPDKRERVQLIAEDTFIALDSEKDLQPDNESWMEVYKALCQQRDEDLKKVLTPEEFERYDMLTTPAGTELARRVIGMNPTEEEMLAMYRLANQHWTDTGGVYGQWRATPLPPDQIAVADQAFEAGLQDVLGPERYRDYQMATTDTGQQLRNFGARYALAPDLLAQAFVLQRQADQLARSSANSPTPQLAAQQQLEQLLGPQLWAAWNDGRYQHVVVEP